MKRHDAAPCLLALIPISTRGSSSALADTIALTGFEEPGTGGKCTDTGDPGTEHPLTNHPDEPPVNCTSTGGELALSSTYYKTRDDVGLTDGEGQQHALRPGGPASARWPALPQSETRQGRNL